MTGPGARGPDDEPVEDLAEEPRAAELLGDAGARVPHPQLRARVLGAANAARPAGGPATALDPVTPVEALRRTQQDLASLIDGLTDADARATTIEGWSVAGLLGHLCAIEEYFGARLGWWAEGGPIDQEHDHLAMTLPAVRLAASSPFDEVRTRWREVVDRVAARLDLLESRMTERLTFNGFDLSVRSLVVVRTFEVWTHIEDICRALDRAPLVPDPARLRLMSDAAVRALPIGMVLADRAPRGRTVRVVLTGAGGGAWIQPLELVADPRDGRGPGEPELTLVAGAIDFCRLAARRIPAWDLDCAVVGDPELAADVLAAAAVFAA